MSVVDTGFNTTLGTNLDEQKELTPLLNLHDLSVPYLRNTSLLWWVYFYHPSCEVLVSCRPVCLDPHPDGRRHVCERSLYRGGLSVLR